MRSNNYFKISLFILLLINEFVFLYLKQYPYAVITMVITLLFLIIVEAFERGLSNIMFKTPQTELDIKMAEKEIEKASKTLATKIVPTKKKAVVQETTELLENSLNAAFHKGVNLGKKQAISVYKKQE